jgi:hypothetical protein
MVLAQNRHGDQWNRMEDPHMILGSYAHLISTKELKIYDGQTTASSTNVARELDVCLQKNGTRYVFFTQYKYQLKVDEGP